MSIEQPPSSTSKELKEYLARQISRISVIADYIVGGLAMLSLKKLTLVGANDVTTGGGQLYLNGVTGNRIDFNINGSSAPTFTTRSAGTKIVLYPRVTASSVDFAIGTEASNLWFSTIDAAGTFGFKWYGGTTLAATLTGAGRLSLTENLGVRTTATAIDNVIVGNITGGATAHGVYVPSVIQSGVTTIAHGISTALGTVATSFTCASLNHFSANQATIGAGSAITNQYGFVADSTLTGATNNYGFYSSIASATGRYNFYAAGTAANYFEGGSTFNTTLLVTGILTNTGGIESAGAITSTNPTGGIGYATGAGGTVTQITSKATGVTLSKVCGTITTHAASLAANTAVSFVLTNTVLAATDNMVLNIVGGTNGAYCLGLDAVAAGSCTITLRNLTAGAIAEAVKIRFSLLKSVNV